MRCFSCMVAGLISSAAIVAQAAPVADDNYVCVQPHVTTAAKDQSVREYWTRERIEKLDHDPRAVEPSPITNEDFRIGQEYPYQGAVRQTVGRLFSSWLTNGTLHEESCTATLVESANRGTILTASHCVHGSKLLAGEGFHDNILWIPGYRDFEAPLGKFTVNSIVLPRVWTEAQSWEDHAFLVLNLDSEGRAAGETLGRGQPLRFDPALPTPNATRWQLGYPRYGSFDESDVRKGTPPFVGDRLASCNGVSEPAAQVPQYLGVRCGMGGGASGGPSFEDFDIGSGYGTLVGVHNIVLGGFVDGVFWSGLYDSNVTDAGSKSLWDAAQAMQVGPLL